MGAQRIAKGEPGPVVLVLGSNLSKSPCGQAEI